LWENSKVSDGACAACVDRSEDIRQLQQIEETLRERDEQLRLLLDSTTEGICGIAPDGRCTFGNAACARMLGYGCAEDLTGRQIHDLIHRTPADGTPPAEAECATCQTFRTGDPVALASDIFWRADGSPIFVEYRSHAVYRDGRLTGCVLTFLDVSDRRQAEEQVRVLSRAVEQAADSIFITDRQGIIRYVNPAFLRLTNFSRTEVLGRRPNIVQSGAHDRAFYARMWGTLLSGKAFRAVFLNRRKDGGLYYEEQTIAPVAAPDGEGYFVSVGRDITDRIEMEKRLRSTSQQLRDLAAHLESVREEERTRIAREIHDELGQILTGLKIDLFRLSGGVEATAPLMQHVHGMASLVDAAIDSVGRIATELRPLALDDRDLATAVEGLARAFQARTGIRCDLSLPPAPLALGAGAVTALFRICQEALTNVVRHADARTVGIRIAQEGRAVTLTVQDDGKGVLQAGGTARKGFGLLGMRERALLHGGSVEITGSPGRGTTVAVRIPASARGSRSRRQDPARRAAS
jgi:PAS domain S-box-containing protein